jgi:hypothetical protein
MYASCIAEIAGVHDHGQFVVVDMWSGLLFFAWADLEP